MTATAEPAFEELLEYLRDSRDFDFTGYKRSTLVRRVSKRMGEIGVDSYASYRAHLEANPDEFTALFNTILINVTSFWRDPEAWQALLRDHLPRVLAAKAPDAQVRVWSAGCASGEETYTIAMALAETLGIEAFRERVKIYATDVDEEALSQARAAIYGHKEMEAVPAELRERYFEPAGGRWVFRNDLRRLVIFGEHDLTRDAPISHLDLLVSRNILMYFNADTQTRILSRFHYALSDGGLLFLGKAEMMRTHGSLFAPVDLRSRIFRKVPRVHPRDRLLLMRPPPRPEPRERAPRTLRLGEAALDALPSAALVVDPAGVVVLASAQARALFGITAADLGRPLHDLTLSYRPVELRGPIEQVRAERRPLVLPGGEIPLAGGELHHFDVHVAPLLDEGALVGVSVVFVDVTPSRRLQADLEAANQELETAMEELQSTNEELETTNEELQSTNEELETMNEELQSTNEELETINDELQRRTAELNHVNAYMRSILTSLRTGVVVLDEAQDIRAWNRKAEDLWGLRAEEVEGRAFQNLDIGLPVERLKGAVRACIEGRSEHEEVVLDAVNRRGRAIRCRVSCTPFAAPGIEVRGAVLVMEEWTGPASEPAPGADGARDEAR